MNRWESFLEATPTHLVSRGNRITHLRDDNRILRTIWTSIEEAETRVWMSMYVIAPDRVGRGTLERLADAAGRGCEVLVICDGYASRHLRREHVAPLEQAGGRVAFFNPLWPPPRTLDDLVVRNHRKLVVLDGARAFCGGFNVSEDYAGHDHGAWVFDDSMAHVEGPAAEQLAQVFIRTWSELTGEERSAPEPAAAMNDGCAAAVLETDPRRGDTRLVDVLTRIVQNARERCYLATPYFVPPPWLYDGLLEAARRGVDVQVVTAGKTDRAVARLAGWHCYGEMLDAGVRIYEMEQRVLHAKTVTVDGQVASIGSYNMDAWTSRHCLDLNVLFVDEAVARSVEEEFFEFVELSREIDDDQVQRRTAVQCWLHEGVYHAYCRL